MKVTTLSPFPAILLTVSTQSIAHTSEETKPTELTTIEVNGHFEPYIGNSLSTSEGVIGDGEIQNRPLLRTGEILEFVPGMAVTQRSGSGKANQYFSRGLIWTTVPISVSLLRVCQLTCARMAMAKAIWT